MASVKNKEIEKKEQVAEEDKKVSVIIPRKVYDEIVDIAIKEGRETFSNQCRYFLIKSLENYKKSKKQ
jgi:hypothetical protein